MKMHKKRPSKKFECCLQMPPLRHKVGDKFDPMKSEVVNWMFQQPDIRDYIYLLAFDYGVIVFNKTTGTWQGRDYKAPSTQDPFDNL